MLALAVRFLRDPVGTSIRVDDKICDPAEESEHYYDESEHYYDGERPTVPRGKRRYCDPSSREGRLHQRQTSMRLDAEADNFAASIRLQAGKPTYSQRLLPVNCVPQLPAQVQPYVPSLAAFDTPLLNSKQWALLSPLP